MSRLSGRVALVCGAARGAGRAISLALAREGASLVVADSGTSREGDGADPSLARDLAAETGGLAYLESLASPGAAEGAVRIATKRLGGLDLLVWAATIRRDSPVQAADPLDIEAVVRNNLLAPIYLVRAAGAEMRKGGRIVLLVDPAGRGEAAFAAAAQGLVGLAESATSDLARREITVTALATSGSRADELATAVLRLADGPAVAGLAGVWDILHLATTEDDA